jgi:hypothetical protein
VSGFRSFRTERAGQPGTHSGPHWIEPSLHRCDPPFAQLTLQLPTLLQTTRHAPVQLTLQLPTRSQSALPFGPSVGVQSLVSRQV